MLLQEKLCLFLTFKMQNNKCDCFTVAQQLSSQWLCALVEFLTDF